MGSSTPRVAGERYGCEGRVYSTCLSSTHKYRRIVPHRGGSGVYDAPRPRRPLGRPGGPGRKQTRPVPATDADPREVAEPFQAGQSPRPGSDETRRGGAPRARPRAGGSFLVNVSFTLLTLVRHWCSYLPTLAHSARTAHANTSKPTSNIEHVFSRFRRSDVEVRRRVARSPVPTRDFNIRCSTCDGHLPHIICPWIALASHSGAAGSASVIRGAASLVDTLSLP